MADGRGPSGPGLRPGVYLLGRLRREPGHGAAERFAVPDAERLDPALLTERERDEEPELDELGHGEMLVEPLPERVVGDLRIPNDGARVGERGLLAGAELVGVGEGQQLVVLRFGQSFPSPLDGALDASVVTIDGFRDVDAAELLDGVVEDAMAKRRVPRV